MNIELAVMQGQGVPEVLMYPHQLIFCLFREGKLLVPLAGDIFLFLPGHNTDLLLPLIVTSLKTLLLS